MMTSAASPNTASRLLDLAQPSRLVDLAQSSLLPALHHGGARALQDALSAYRATTIAPGVDKPHSAEKPVLDFTLDGVATTVAQLRDSTRHALDELAATMRGIKVERIKIDGYDPVLSLVGDERANAVMGYLSAKGVDKDLMWTEGHWRKPWDRDFKLADKHCVVIKVYGQPTAATESLPV